LEAATFERLTKQHGKDLNDLILKTLYQERIRIKEDPWKVDPPNDRAFWKKVGKQLIKKSLDRQDSESQDSAEQILQRIIRRYAEEIVGTFKISTFRFAQRFLTWLFNRILNTAGGKSIRGLWSGRKRLYERLNVVGHVELTRDLFNKGTVVAVPTHFSNLDSILVGYAMDQIMGLPSFSYGAGLNLYNFGPAAYYMNRLGAYRVDRRKKNTIYLETLKTMSKLSIERGVNSLFFPGGTRSRSGALEADLKMGLLGTAVEAQRALVQQGAGKKVFIIPIVINYHFVIEAPFLIEQHLKRTGREHYLRLKDEGASVRSWLRFVWRFLSTTSEITLSIGRPMDVLGNFVDAEGHSCDQYGSRISIADYFTSNNKVNVDVQREEEYTKLLAERILERYKAENVVLSSHLMAFTVFRLLLIQNPKLDLYGILRLPPDDYVFPIETIYSTVAQLQEVLIKWEEDEKIRLHPEIKLPVQELVETGVKNLGIYHHRPPLEFTKQGDLVSSDFRVLYYYHNRLDSYELERKITWKPVQLELSLRNEQ
jgi:glycerol-3-phosphate O-acyltransferase